jgi:hypothetical protein
MAVHHGKAGAVMLQIDAGTAKQIASISEWTLDMGKDTVETTGMGAPNKTYVVGLPDIKGTLAAFWDDADDSFFDGIDSETGVTLELYPDKALTPNAKFAGPAWLSGSIKSGVSAAVTLSGNFVANGAWTRTPASGGAAKGLAHASAPPAQTTAPMQAAA